MPSDLKNIPSDVIEKRLRKLIREREEMELEDDLERIKEYRYRDNREQMKRNEESRGLIAGRMGKKYG